MMAVIKEMLTSKKFLAALLAAIVWIAGRFGAHLDYDALMGAVTPLWLYVVGQALADHGKSAEIVAQAGIGTSPSDDGPVTDTLPIRK